MAVERLIPSSNEIRSFVHCATCLANLPVGESPDSWSRLDIGWTELGFQVWCRRCDANVMHVDIDGADFRANVSRLR